MAGQVISRLTSSGGTDAGVHVISSSFYGTCSTAADTSAKEIIIQNRNIDQQINLTKGMLLVVKFDYGNTNADSLPTFQLFKNDAASSTSMPIKGTNLSSILPVFAQARTNIKPSWNPGSVVPFIYDTYTYTDPDTGAAVTSGCWIKAAGISDEIIFGIKDDEGQVITTGLVDRVETIQSDVYTSQVVADIEYIYWPIDSETPPPQTPESTSQYQWTTDTLSYDPSLDIWARTKSFTIGNTSNPTYSNPMCISGRDGAKGDTGAAALTYALIADVTSLTRDVNTTTPVNNPSTITFSATKTEGNGAPLPYLEGQLTVKQYIYDTNKSDWVWESLTTQSFSPNTLSITVTPSNKATSVKGILFASDGTTQLDTQTIPIIENGESAVVAYLTNESCSFAATSSAAITASASSQFIVNQGGQPLNVTINSITPDITSTPAVNDQVLTVTSSGNNFTVNITDGFTTTNANYPHNGSFKIAATASVNGASQTFTKDFSWVLVPAGVDGKNGTNGANGFNIADIKLYKISDSNGVSKPKGDLIYTFNTQELTPAENLDGWSVNMPNMTQVTPGWSCYLISANAASLEATDVIKGIGYDDSAEDNSDWYGPVVFVQNGTNGIDAYNHATVSLYQRSLTEPTEPSGSINYTFSDGSLTPTSALGNWTTGVTAAVDGEPCWVISANAVSQGETYTINDWSDPVIFTRDGTDGEGVSITNREIHYIESTSGTVTPADDAQWKIIIPDVAEGKYLWTRTRVTYSDGNALTSYSVAKQGEGITVTGSSIEYATNNSTTTPISGWQNTPPSTTPGWYIWTKTTTNYSDGTAVTSYSVGKTGTNGSNAYLYELHCSPSVITVDQNVTTPAFSPAEVTLSATRTNGNSTPAAYSGRFKLEWTSDNSTWTAIATNGNSNTPSWTQTITPVSVTAATAFRATLYKAGGTTNVLDTETIPVIRGGKNGINGYNQSTVYLYKRFGSNEQLTKPSSSHTYNFTNKTFTDTDATDNDKIEGWTINKIPAADGDKIAWMIFAVASSTTPTDEILATEWSDPIKVEGINGADGFNHATIQLYKRYRFPENENDKPVIPAANAVTYTFNPPSLTENVQGALNGWTQTPPKVDGNPCWITVGIAHSQSNSDPIDNWSVPVIYTKDGADGYNKATVYLYKRAASEPTGNTAKPSAQLTYTFENQTLTSTADLNDWSQTIPTNSTAPLWMIAAVANSTAATDPIETSDWSHPVKMEGIDGQPGTPGTDGYNQATIDLYKRADSAPTSSMPGTLTYTFGATNPLSAPQNKWSQTIPATNGQPCWVTSGTAVSRNASATISNWSTPTKMLEDSINVVIDNDNVTFPTTNGAAAKTTVTCNIKAFKGLTQVPCTIGTISGAPTTGMTISKTNGTATTPAKITIAVSESTSSLLTTEQGTLTIPVTVSGVTNSINKQFTWSLAKNGLNQVTLYLYKRADSATKPTSGNDSVYNFTDKTLTNIPSGWSTAFPKETQGSTIPVWVMTAVASSNTDTGNIAYTEWSTPVRYVSSGSNGKDAFNEAKVFLYRRSTETPVAPTFNEPFNYTFSTGLTADSYNTNTSPAVTWYTDPALATVTSGAATSNIPRNDHMPCWISINHPISQSASATITSNWSTPTIFAQPGKGIIKVTEYYLATNNTTNVTIETTGWVTPNNEVTPPITIPQLNSNAIYLWNYEATEYTDGVIRIIAPHIIAMYDANKGTFSSITNYYQKTKTATTVPEKNDNDWSTSMLQVDNEWKYLWNYKKITYASGDPEYTDVHLIGIYGDNGIGIEDIIEQQILWPYDDSNLTEHPGPGNDANWQSKGDVIWEPGKYIWSQTKVIWTDGKIDYIGRTVAKDINDLNEKMRLTNSGSGTIITSNDAASLPPLSITIHGKSVQNGTPSPNMPVKIQSVESHNLLDLSDVQSATINGIEWTINVDGTISASGTASATSAFGIGTLMFKSGIDYIVSGCPQLGGSDNYEFMVQQSATTGSGGWQHDYGEGQLFSGDGVAHRMQLVVRNNQTVNLTFEPMICMAPCTGGFQRIETISILSVGKNIMPPIVHTTASASNKVALVRSRYRSMFCKVQGGKTYTISRRTVEGNRFQIFCADSMPVVGVTLNLLANEEGELTATVTMPEGYDWLYIYLANDGSDITPDNIQVELGSTATEYEPYQGITTPIDLQGNPPAVIPSTISLGNGDYITTDNYEDFTKDFCLFIGFFRVAASRHCFVSPYSSLPGVGIELTAGGLVRVYSIADTGVVTDKSLGTAVSIGSQCRFALMWSATAKTYTWLSVHDGLRESGTFTPSGSYTGISANPLRMGGDFRDPDGGKTTFPNAWTQWNTDPYFEGAFPENYASMMWYYNGNSYSWGEIGGYKLRSLPDGTRDALDVVDEKKTLTKRVGVAVIDGVNVKARAITKYSPNVRAEITLPNQATVGGGDARLNTYADKFSVSSAPVNVPAQSASEYTFELYSSYSFAVIPITALSAASTAAVNEWFASNPVTVLYPLAEPQTIDLGKINLSPLPSPIFSMYVDALVTPILDAEWWTILGYETGKQHTAANSLLTSLSNEITKTQEALTDNAVIETNQLWFITDKKEKPDKPNEQLVNNTGDYDNWVTKVSDSYIILNPNETDNRYEITKDTSNNYIVKDKIIQDTANQNRDVTEFCIVKKQDNNDEYIYKYYPYNYYCYEYKFLNGEVTYSEVIYDSVKSSIAENKIAEEYQQKALEKLLNDQTQVFYSDNNGAHVKDTTGSNYVTTWNTTGIIFSQGDAKLLDILAISGENGKYSGMNIYNGKTGRDEQKIAQFIPNLIQLGSDEEDRVRITREKIEFIKGNKSAAEIGNDGFYTPNITVDSKLSLKTPTGSINSENQNETYEWAWIPRSNGNIAFKWIGTPDPNL